MIKVVINDDQTIILIITWTLPKRKITGLSLSGKIRDLKTLLLGFLQGQGWRIGPRWREWWREVSLDNAAWFPLRLTFQVRGQMAKENHSKDSHCQ